MSNVFERKKGSGEWWIDFKEARGVRHRKKIGAKRIAKEVLNGILGNVARRQHLGIIEESPILFAAFAKEWPRFQSRGNSALAFSGTISNLRSINRAAVEGYVAERLAGGPNRQTVDRELSVLRHIVKRALRWDEKSVAHLISASVTEYHQAQRAQGFSAHLKSGNNTEQYGGMAPVWHQRWHPFGTEVHTSSIR